MISSFEPGKPIPSDMAKVRRAILVVLVVAVGYLAAAILIGPQGRLGFLVDRGAVAAASLVAARLCLQVARRGYERLAPGWRAMALTAACWALFNGAAAGQAELPRQASTLGWVMHASGALAAVLALFSVLMFLVVWISRTARMRVLLDGCLVGASLLFCGWALVLERTYASGAGTPERVWNLAYPVSDVILISLVLVLILRVPSDARTAWALLAIGIAAVALAHATFAYLELAQAWRPGSPETFLWVVGAALVGAAAASARDDCPPPPSPGEVELRTSLDVWLPFVPVLAAGIVGVTRARHGQLTTFLQFDGLVIVVLLLARQVVAQKDAFDLARHMEFRVQQRTEELGRQQRQFRALVKNASDIVTVVDASGRIQYQSESARRILGADPERAMSRMLRSWIHPDDADNVMATVRSAPPPSEQPAVVECRLPRADGRWCICETTVTSLLADEDVRGVVLTSRDLSERKRFEEELRQQGLHDGLTGLANRQLLLDRLEHAIARGGRTPHSLAVLMLDLDGFKQVNDSLGHEAGDRLLVEVSRRLRASVREGDTVARLGGDEFAVVLDPANQDLAEVVARRIIGRLRVPVDLGKSVVVQGSIGIAMGSTAEVSAEEMIRNADLAMYQAKSQGKNGVVTYQSTMRTAAVARMELEADLRRAINRRELTVHYQPIVEIPSGRIISVEALSRWQHPERGTVSPAEFIQIAEESDLALSLGSWVLREACHAATRFQAAYPSDPPLTVSVNLSTRQLRSPTLIEDLHAALADTGIDPATLILEITEGALMGEGGATARTLEAIRDLAIRLAIDAFATGWSSLSRLREFPVDELKIDRSFVQEITSGHDEAPIVAAVVAMAHSLGLSVVAEGVETIAQLTALTHYGCDSVQGYLLAKPLPADVLLALLADPHGLLEPAEAAPHGKKNGGRRASVSVEQLGAGETVHYILAELARVADADASYISFVHEDDLTEEVRWVVANGEATLPEGITLPWVGSPSHEMLHGGPREIPSLGHRDHELARTYGVHAWAGVPITGFPEASKAVLAVVNTGPGDQAENVVALLELFGQLLTEHLAQALPASPSR